MAAFDITNINMKILNANKNIIIEKYESGAYISALASEWNVSCWSINNLLKTNNIKIKKREDLLIKFNESFFFENKPETYYFWGFTLGDGSLVKHSKCSNELTFSIHEKDVEILKRFCNWLDFPESKIKYYRNKKIARLSICRKFFNKDFSKFGLVHRKTYNPSKLEIPDEFLKPFILGFIDADGSTAFNKKIKSSKSKSGFQKETSLNLVGHPYNMDWVIESFRKIGYLGKINTQMVKNKWKRIRIQRKNDLKNLINLLEVEKYKHFLLERKWTNYDQI